LIPVFATWPGLKSTLASRVKGVRVEVIVDDHSGGSRYEPLRTLVESLNENSDRDPARLTFMGVNSGFAATINNGLRQLGGSGPIMILNSDVELTRSGWELLRDLAGVIPRKNFWGVIPRSLHLSIISEKKRGRVNQNSDSTPRIIDFPYPSFEIGIFGSNPALGGVLLDEALYRSGYGEDTEWCIRARGLGWEVRAFDWPRQHLGSATFGLSKKVIKGRAREIITAMYPNFPEDLESCEHNVALGIRDRSQSLGQDLDATSSDSPGTK